MKAILGPLLALALAGCAGGASLDERGAAGALYRVDASLTRDRSEPMAICRRPGRVFILPATNRLLCSPLTDLIAPPLAVVPPK